MAGYPRNFLFPTLSTLLLLLAAATATADSKDLIDSGSRGTLDKLREQSKTAAQLLDRAAGVLVFPDVVKMGFGAGGEYGEGALWVGGKTVAYYSTSGAAYGLQLGDQFKAEVILFMDEQALQGFRDDHAWEVGVDAGVTMADPGGEGTATMGPVLGFIFSNAGFTRDLSMQGSKITRIAR